MIVLLAAAAGAGSTSGGARVPILMYHVVAAPVAGAPYPALYVPKAEFSAEMGWLARHRYHAVTLDQVYASWQRGGRLPSRPVVVTFDDGYRSVYTNALPVLRSLRWPGVLDLEVRNERRTWGLPPPLVRELVAAGWELDSHSVTHPDLTRVGASRLRYEVAGSRMSLRSRYRVPVDFFSYPSGRYNAAVLAAVEAAGYLGATTTRYGLADAGELYTLARVRVDGGDGVAGLAARLGALGA